MNIKESWNLSKGEAMGELESIGLSDQDNREKYKILLGTIAKDRGKYMWRLYTVFMSNISGKARGNDK